MSSLSGTKSYCEVCNGGAGKDECMFCLRERALIVCASRQWISRFLKQVCNKSFVLHILQLDRRVKSLSPCALAKKPTERTIYKREPRGNTHTQTPNTLQKHRCLSKKESGKNRSRILLKIQAESEMSRNRIHFHWRDARQRRQRHGHPREEKSSSVCFNFTISRIDTWQQSVHPQNVPLWFCFTDFPT